MDEEIDCARDWIVGEVIVDVEIGQAWDEQVLVVTGGQATADEAAEIATKWCKREHGRSAHVVPVSTFFISCCKYTLLVTDEIARVTARHTDDGWCDIRAL